MSLTELTPFELDLIRLRYIENKLMLLWKAFPNLKGEKKEFTFKSLVQEHIIIILDSFIEARKTILKDLKLNGYGKLDLALRPLCDPILEHEKTIRNLRDNYFAHLQTGQKKNRPFEILIGEILTISGFPSSTGDMLILVGSARLYIELIRKSCNKEWKNAIKKYENQRIKLNPVGIYSEKQAPEIIKKRGNQAISNLKDFGILPQIS